MALKSPLMPSPTFQSVFSPYTDSPSSPASFNSTFPMPNRSSGTSDKDTLHPPPSPYPQYVDPSPVDSNNSASTDATEIEMEAVEENDQQEQLKSPDIEIMSPDTPADQTNQETLTKLDTDLPPHTKLGSSDDGPESVIHAPQGFKQFSARRSPPYRNRSTPSPTEESENTVVSPDTPEAQAPRDDKRSSVAFTSPINTSIPSAKDRSTPRASTKQEAEEEWRRRSRASKSLEDIAEADDAERHAEGEEEEEGEEAGQAYGEAAVTQALKNLDAAEQEIKALKAALSECWTLCNTLANLSSIHRQRIFEFSGKGEIQEHAWRTCWRLCQKLYDSRDEDHASEVRPTLELCRDFCQALFEARQRGDETTDSILRVSFELNNHLYNTHDRNLPEAFRERTLDFYLTLCHRLMKQRTSLPEETDALLRACWSLAEMLFSLRQNSRDHKPPDEELLGSAVQACWDLCDLFREGWTQIRPDRGTPRPAQRSYATSQRVRSPPSVSSSRPSSSLSLDNSFRTAKSPPPETPTTIFDETTELSPDEPNIPNILVLGPDTSGSVHHRWSSAASNVSAYSDTSQHTSSTATAGTTSGRDPEDPHSRLIVLILKAAMNSGYTRNLPQTLSTFVKTLPSNSFGTLPWQLKLLESYKKLVVADPTLRDPGALPARRLSAAEVARAVQWMSRSEQFVWLRDLYRLVFGFFPEDAAGRKNVFVQT